MDKVFGALSTATDAKFSLSRLSSASATPQPTPTPIPTADADAATSAAAPPETRRYDEADYICKSKSLSLFCIPRIPCFVNPLDYLVISLVSPPPTCPVPGAFDEASPDFAEGFRERFGGGVPAWQRWTRQWRGEEHEYATTAICLQGALPRGGEGRQGEASSG